MAFCGKCGQQVNEGVRFCPACGQGLEIRPVPCQPRLAFMHRHVWLDHSGLRSDRPLAGDPMEGIGLMEHLLSLRYGIEPRLHRVYGTGSHRYH